MKKTIALLLAAVLLLGLAACGKEKPDPTETQAPATVQTEAPTTVPTEAPRLTPEEVLQKTSETMSKATSAGFGITMVMDVEDDIERVRVVLTMKGEAIQDPMITHMVLHADLYDPEEDDIDLEVYGRQNGDMVEVYTGVTLDGEMLWQKDVEEFEPIPGIAAASSDALTMLGSLKEDGFETVDNVKATRYTAEITIDHMLDMVDELGLMGEIMDEAMDFEDMLYDFSEDAKVAVTYLVDEENMTLLSMKLDMTPLMKAYAKENPEEAEGVTIHDVSYTLTYRNVNDVTEIEIPQEALDAPEF